MAKNNKMPAIRFSGYTDTWEQRKLNDVFQIIDGDRGKNYPGTGDFLSNGDVLFLDTGNVRKDGFNFDNKRYIDVNRDKLLHNGRLILGDYVLTSRGTLGNLAYYSQSIYNRYPQIRINSAMLILRVMNTIKVNNLYLYITLRSNVINEFMKHNFVGSAQPHIIKKEFSSVLLPIPRQLEEQKIIGDFFDKLEKIITLHQRKLEKLKLTKKALLQKLFPQNGSKFPELRFKGFTAAWEQRKLSEVVTINPKTELPDEFKYVDLESVVGTNLLGFQVIKKENAPSRAQRLASYGDVFYQTVRPYQRNNYLFENIDKDMVFSTGYAQLRSKLDSYFLLTLVQNDNFVKVVLDNCTGTSYPAINGSELGKITVQIPSSEVEANQIGKVFRGIDKSITLHQRKLEMLKNVKKGLLQKMFV